MIAAPVEQIREPELNNYYVCIVIIAIGFSINYSS